MTDQLGQSQVLPYLQGLSETGYKYTLVSFEKRKAFDKNKELVVALLANYEINWVPLTYHKFPPVLSTLFDLYKLWRKVNQLVKTQKFKIIHCRSYLTTLVGLPIKKRYDIKLIFDMRGFWADERLEGGIWNIRNPLFRYIYRYFKKQEKLFFRQSDYIISLTNAAKQFINENEPSSAPISVIPCCADLALFSPENVSLEAKQSLRQTLGIADNSFILLYLGSLGTWYMLDEMLDFFLVLRHQKPFAKFLIVTKDNPAYIRSVSRRKGITDNQLIIVSSERKTLPQYISLAHLSIFFIRPVFSKKASSPTKQGEIMGMGIPVICNSGIGDSAEIIQKTGAGAVIAEFREDIYREACEHLDDLVSINPDKIRSGARYYYSLKNGIEAYRRVYEELR
jgi:glycosyltransferase involved in cell wall biosynthesis